MGAVNTTATLQHRAELLGQTVVVIGGSAGIGLETARRARAAGAELILAARNPERLDRIGSELGALDGDLFSEGVRNHEAQSHIQAAMKRGFQTRDGELALAAVLGRRN